MKKIVTVIFICLIVLKLGIGGQSIHESAKKGDIEKIKSMIKENPELIFLQNRYGMIPLHTSAYNGKIEVFEFFLKKGVDLNSATRTGKTALFYAEINQQKNMIACQWLILYPGQRVPVVSRVSSAPGTYQLISENS